MAAGNTFGTVVTTLAGTELVQALPVDANSHPAASNLTTNAQSIAQLAGAGAFGGTFVLTGTTPVTVANTNVAIGTAIAISLNTVGGTVGAAPSLKTITAGVGFTVSGTALDTSTYNYAILG